MFSFEFPGVGVLFASVGCCLISQISMLWLLLHVICFCFHDFLSLNLFCFLVMFFFCDFWSVTNPPFLFGWFSFCYFFLLVLFSLALFSFEGFKGQVRWRQGPTHFALNPPYLFWFVFIYVVFVSFCLWKENPTFPLKQGHFCSFANVSLCLLLDFSLIAFSSASFSVWLSCYFFPFFLSFLLSFLLLLPLIFCLSVFLVFLLILFLSRLLSLSFLSWLFVAFLLFLFFFVVSWCNANIT